MGKLTKLLLDKLLKQTEVAFDTETNSLDALSANLVGISFSFEAGKVIMFLFQRF